MFANQKEFFDEVNASEADQLLDRWFSEERLPHAFSTKPDLESFLAPIRRDWPSTQLLFIAGSGAWRYSLNPRNDFSEFHPESDIDVVNISETHFDQTWERLRDYHRKNWYLIGSAARLSLLRNGENIYGGFVCPTWIPDLSDPLRFKFITKLQNYSTRIVGYRTVNMFFFKNFLEVKDYYRRGIEIAKNRI